MITGKIINRFKNNNLRVSNIWHILCYEISADNKTEVTHLCICAQANIRSGKAKMPAVLSPLKQPETGSLHIPENSDE